MVTVLIDTRAIESATINYLLFFIKKWAWFSNLVHQPTVLFIIYNITGNAYYTLIN